ncbi:MAG: hypothetical protein LBL74_05840 [Bacteroidales bacterium]|jgi:hypothetical protein|nr:hypothetical protein [Bacteroidales bacterium]
MRQHPIAAYLTRLSIFSIVVCFTCFFFMFFTKGLLSPRIPYYIVMFWLLTGGGYCLLYFLPKNGSMNFVNTFMIVKFGKIIIYLGVLAIAYLLDIEKGRSFALLYFAIFILYLIFDTITLNSLVKKNK